MFSKALALKLCALVAMLLFLAAAARAQQTHVFTNREAAGQVVHFNGADSIPIRVNMVGSVDACSWGPERLDVFGRGADGQIKQISRVNGQWLEADLGGAITSSPTCVSWGPNRIDIFARGADGTLVHKAWNGTRWTALESLGGQLPEGAAPDAASWGPNRLDIFLRGTDNLLWQSYWDGSRWGWHKFEGEIRSDPGAVSWGANRIDVFAVDPAGEMRQIAWDGEQWTEWFRHGAGFDSRSEPDVSSPAVNRLDVFARGANGKLKRKRWDGSQWSSWRDLDVPREGGSGPGAVALRGVPDTSPRTARFRVTLTGFTVNRETWDDVLERDGKRDEVFLVSDAMFLDPGGSFSFHKNLRDVVIIGDTNNLRGRVRGGTASDLGGLKTGDPHPRGVSLDRPPARHLDRAVPPFIAFEGEVVQGRSSAVIIPTVWEWDEPMSVFEAYKDFMMLDVENHIFDRLRAGIVRLIGEPRSAIEQYVVDGTQLGIGDMRDFVSIAAGGTGEVAARPIGMTRRGDKYGFVAKVFLMTYEAGILATRGGPPGSFGVVPINYRDAEDLKGDYTLFLIVERLPD